MGALVQTLLQIVDGYYRQGWSQGEIADRLRLSRSSVSRLIAQARSLGLVDFHPRIPGSVRPGLAAFLTERFALRDVVIVEDGGAASETLRERLGWCAACYLQLVLREGMVIGLSWGTAHTIAAFEPRSVPGSQVVQLAGGLEPPPRHVPLNELVQRLAGKLNATAHYLFAPAIAADAETARMLHADRTVARVLDVAGKADIALFGIGDMELGSTVPSNAALTGEEVTRLAAAGAVGATCVRFFTASGCVADDEIDRRTVGLTLAQMAAIPTKIAVVGEAHKLAALNGALRAGLVDILITGDRLAEALLDGSPSPAPSVTGLNA